MLLFYLYYTFESYPHWRHLLAGHDPSISGGLRVDEILSILGSNVNVTGYQTINQQQQQKNNKKHF